LEAEAVAVTEARPPLQCLEVHDFPCKNVEKIDNVMGGGSFSAPISAHCDTFSSSSRLSTANRNCLPASEFLHKWSFECGIRLFVQEQ
jgi:hypothetical protein